ncbi:MAG: hypothetical protein EOM17_16075 [Synergistales bacterium]|nr:hypothetical protein [Synergistales bacterium]
MLLSVKLTERGKSEACASKGNGKFAKPNSGYPGYAIFPFQGNNQDSIKNAQKGVEFELVVESPEALRQDVEAALWAFCNFGGLGARTRRGCGALFCEDFAPADSTELLKMIDIYRKHDESPAHPWPELFTSLLLKDGDSSDASRAWNQAIKVLGDFRQGPGEGRNPPNDDPHRPGRSLWPEPETIREVTDRRDENHQRMNTIPDDGFPRAEFGLPIIFHFQPPRDPKAPKDPQDSQLLPYFTEANGEEKEGGRMASPLILRPILFKNGKAVSMILQLKTPPLETVALKFSSGRESVIKLFERKHIVHQRFAAYSKSPLGTPKKGGAVRSPKGSAIEGFLAFARENGFQEVKK